MVLTKSEVLKINNIIDTYDDDEGHYLLLDDMGYIYLCCPNYESDCGGGDVVVYKNLYWEFCFDDEEQAKEYWNKNNKDQIVMEMVKEALDKQSYDVPDFPGFVENY